MALRSASFPIGWVVFTAILLYRVTVESGKFEILKDSIANLTTDRRLQALLIAFAFGAFIEGAAGFGTPVAVAGAMLAGLGFTPFYAAAICLLANTAPVAFGSIAIPITTLALTTGLPRRPPQRGRGPHLRAGVAFHPGLSRAGDVGMERAARRLPGGGRVRYCVRRHAVRGVEFRRAAAHRYPRLAWPRWVRWSLLIRAVGDPRPLQRGTKTAREVLLAWTPYILLVVFVLAWGEAAAAIEQDKYRDSLADAAQHDPPHAARRGKAGAIRRGIYVRLAFGLGDGLPDRGHLSAPSWWA